MSGKNQISSFKDKFGTSSTFVGGTLAPERIGIVGLDPKHPHYIKGVDVPLEDWNQDLWDAARLTLALSDPIDPEKLIKTVDMGGSIPPVEVTYRRELVLTVDGRRKILGTRAANKLLVKRGTSVDELIELAIIVNKATDLEVSVRVGNAGRLEDPPYVKAANAARLKARGKSEEQIASILEAEITTVNNWLAYAKYLSPQIKEKIEHGPKGERVPFAVGVELAKGSVLDEDQAADAEWDAQHRALVYLLNTNAKLTGEKGRENAKAVIRSVMTQQLDLDADIHLEEPDKTPPAIQKFISEAPKTNGVSPKPRAESKPKITTQQTKLSWSALRELAAHLEPSPNDPHNTDADRVAHAIFQVLMGSDPSADGLLEWPRIQTKFRKVVRSPSAPIPLPPGVVEQPCPSCSGTGRVGPKKELCRTCHGSCKIKVKTT